MLAPTDIYLLASAFPFKLFILSQRCPTHAAAESMTPVRFCCSIFFSRDCPTVDFLNLTGSPDVLSSESCALPPVLMLFFFSTEAVTNLIPDKLTPTDYAHRPPPDVTACNHSLRSPFHGPAASDLMNPLSWRRVPFESMLLLGVPVRAMHSIITTSISLLAIFPPPVRKN